jgi:hypothetical protein
VPDLVTFIEALGYPQISTTGRPATLAVCLDAHDSAAVPFSNNEDVNDVTGLGVDARYMGFAALSMLKQPHHVHQSG